MTWLHMLGLAEKSPTEDEWAHLTRGAVYWQTGDPRTSFGHPPLANLIAAIPTAFDATIPDLTQYGGWDKSRVGHIAIGWLRHDYDNARAHLVAGRKVMLFFHVCLVLYLYWVTRELFGTRAAIVATIFAAFHPVFLAQARYVTTDAPAGLGGVLVAGEMTRYLLSRGWWPLLRMALAVAAALLLKYSILVVVAAAIAIGLGAALAGIGRFDGTPIIGRVGTAFAHMVLTGIVAIGGINAGYSFRDTGLTVGEVLEKPEPNGMIHRIAKSDVFEKYTPLPQLPQSLRIPLPYTYVYGIATMRGYNRQGFSISWFAGENNPKGSRWYFPVMIAIKSPIAWLLGLMLGVGLAFRRPRRTALWLLLAFSGAYLAVSMRSSLNMGVRHALPILTMATPVAALGLAEFPSWVRDTWQRTATRLVGAAVGSVVVAGIFAAPDFLGWFNIAVGRDRGHQISLVGEDWGQDRLEFARFAQAYELQPLYYDVQTSTRKLEVEWAGLKYRSYRCATKKKRPPSDPRGSWLAIHSLRVERLKCNTWLRDRKPEFEINNHIRVYWIPDDDPGVERQLRLYEENRRRRQRAAKKKRLAQKKKKAAKRRTAKATAAPPSIDIEDAQSSSSGETSDDG